MDEDAGLNSFREAAEHSIFALSRPVCWARQSIQLRIPCEIRADGFGTNTDDDVQGGALVAPGKRGG